MASFLCILAHFLCMCPTVPDEPFWPARGLLQRAQHCRSLKHCQKGVNWWQGHMCTGLSTAVWGVFNCSQDSHSTLAHDWVSNVTIQANRHQILTQNQKSHKFKKKKLAQNDPAVKSYDHFSAGHPLQYATVHCVLQWTWLKKGGNHGSKCHSCVFWCGESWYWCVFIQFMLQTTGCTPKVPCWAPTHLHWPVLQWAYSLYSCCQSEILTIWCWKMSSDTTEGEFWCSVPNIPRYFF